MTKMGFNFRTLCILLLGVAMNYLFFRLAFRYDCPLWLDCSGTAYAALLLGPLAGILVGVINNLILAFCYFTPVTSLYAIVNVAVALIVGGAARGKAIRNVFGAVGVAFFCYLASVILATVIDCAILHNGVSNIWEKWLCDAFTGIANHWSAVLLARTLVKIPDMLVSVILVWFFYSLTPRPAGGKKAEKGKEKDRKKEKKEKREKKEKKGKEKKK